MISKAATVAEYLSELTPEERADIQKVRSVIKKNLPKGYKESVQWGMICYSIPLSRYADTYNGQALCYAALAAQKNHNAVYLMNVYGHPGTEKWFKARYKASGKRLDMGKSCVRFRRADDLPLDVIGEAIARTSVEDYIGYHEKARGRTKSRGAKKATKQVSKRKAAKKR
jgi:uncharacterized protein YdhG (YjbR/CyaY superfamily)